MMLGPEMDALVATTVLGWIPADDCDGEIGELPISSDGWFCQKCGEVGEWDGSCRHRERPLHYSTDIEPAWAMHKFCCRWTIEDRHLYLHSLARVVRERVQESVPWPNLLALMEPEDFCRAALYVKGVKV